MVIKSGRRRAQVMEDARLLGQTAYIFEVGAGLVIDGETTFLTDELQPREGETVHAQIAATGAPELLLDHYGGRLESHAPFHLDREVSHLFRGSVDADEANALLAAEGHGGLRLVDNGEIAPDTHTFHLIPAGVSKARAVAAHMRARGYAREECVAVGDSREDLEVADVVGRLFLVANAVVGRHVRVRQRGAHRGGDERGFLRSSDPGAGRGALRPGPPLATLPAARNQRYNLGVSGSVGIASDPTGFRRQ